MSVAEEAAKEIIETLKGMTEEQIAALPPEVLAALSLANRKAQRALDTVCQGREAGPYEDALFEMIVQLILTDLPEAIGVYAGRVAAQVVEYGDSCHWGTMDEDAELFKKALLDGFDRGLSDASVVPHSWPEREQVIEAFATVAKLADSGPLAHHIDCFEREKHFTPTIMQ